MELAHTKIGLTIHQLWQAVSFALFNLFIFSTSLNSTLEINTISTQEVPVKHILNLNDLFQQLNAAKASFAEEPLKSEIIAKVKAGEPPK